MKDNYYFENLILISKTNWISYLFTSLYHYLIFLHEGISLHFFSLNSPSRVHWLQQVSSFTFMWTIGEFYRTSPVSEEEPLLEMLNSSYFQGHFNDILPSILYPTWLSSLDLSLLGDLTDAGAMKKVSDVVSKVMGVRQVIQLQKPCQSRH